jgi:hypothetical protein
LLMPLPPPSSRQITISAASLRPGRDRGCGRWPATGLQRPRMCARDPTPARRMKPSDRYSVSLCTGSHALQHQFGQLTIWRVLPIDAQRVFPNPILQGFRRDNLIALAHHRLTLLDDERLQSIEFTNCLDEEPLSTCASQIQALQCWQILAWRAWSH